MIIDLTILENICNLKCKYCRGCFGYDKTERRIGDNISLNYDSFKELSLNPFIKDHFVSVNKNHFISIYEISKSIISTLKVIEQSIPITSLKVSGGEIFIFPEIIDSISKSAFRNKKIKILSNGTLLSKTDILGWKKVIPDLTVQFSLDGIDSSTNSNRTNSEKTTNKIKTLIAELANCKIPVEINTVLSKQSIDGFLDLLDWLLYLDNDFIVYPRLVRNMNNSDIFPTNVQISDFIKSMHILDKKKRNLFISESYIARLTNSFINVKKTNCIVPENVLAVSLSGNINHCTIGGTPLLGNIFTNPNLLHQVLHKECSLPSNCWNVCNTCISEYDIFNFNN